MKTDIFNSFVRDLFQSKEKFVPLHVPVFNGNEKEYLLETIDSTFVSSVGKYVDKVESFLADYTKTSKGVAVVNGTAAIQVALRLVGVSPGDEVITQALTFVATANSIEYNGAKPVFVDVDKDTMGLSPRALESFLEEYGERRDQSVYNRKTGKRISAVLPMHTFGFMCRISEIQTICNEWGIPCVEDAAEALGSQSEGQSAGSFGSLGAFSFNGNKIVTAGGGGVIVSNDIDLGTKAKYLTTTAKRPHSFEYFHDELGYNFRMPNLNAALLLAQLEKLEEYRIAKSSVYGKYQNFFNTHFKYAQLMSIPETTSQWNYWLMSVQLENREDRDTFLNATNSQGVMTRPIWQLMYKLPMYSDCQRDDQRNAEFLEDTIVNIPSSAINEKIRIGYFADGPWSHLAFEKLIEDSSIEIVFIVPRTDTSDNTLLEYAKTHRIDYITPVQINSEKFYLKALQYNCDLFVSMSFNQIFRKRIIELPRLNTINCHAGKLPFYRGRNILNWALINDEKEFGITVHYIDEGIDTGDIILQRCFPITDTDDYATLLKVSYKECADILYDAIKHIQNRDSQRIKQETIHPVGFYCGRRVEGDEIIDWNQSSRDIFNFIRAICEPGPRATTYLNGLPVHINRSRMIQDAPNYKGKTGQIISKTVEGFLVKTRDSFVEILEVESDIKLIVGHTFG